MSSSVRTSVFWIFSYGDEMRCRHKRLGPRLASLLLPTTLDTIQVMSSQQWSDQANVYAKNVPQLTSLHALDLIRLLLPEIQAAKTILDVGCGTGAFAQAYLQVFPQGIPGQTLIMTDLSSGMLEKAREAIGSISDHVQTEITFQTEDATMLDGIADDSVDLVVSLFGVFLVPDQEACRRAICRVLRNDSGVFANASWIFGRTLEGFGISLQDAFVTPIKAVDPDFSMRAMEAWGRDDDIRTIMAEYGFTQVSIHHAIHTNVWNFDVLWNMMQMNPMSNLKDASPDTIDKARQALINVIDQDITKPIVLWAASNLSVGLKRKQ